MSNKHDAKLAGAPFIEQIGMHYPRPLACVPDASPSAIGPTADAKVDDLGRAHPGLDAAVRHMDTAVNHIIEAEQALRAIGVVTSVAIADTLLLEIMHEIAHVYRVQAQTGASSVRRKAMSIMGRLNAITTLDPKDNATRERSEFRAYHRAMTQQEIEQQQEAEADLSDIPF